MQGGCFFCAGFDQCLPCCIKYSNLIFGGGDMREINLALLGGDKRELEAARLLAACKNCRVRCFGLPQGDLPQGEKIKVADDVAGAVRGADALLLPMAGVDWLAREDLAGLVAGTPVLVGVANGRLRGLCAELGLPLCALAGRDELAVPNAVPTAEGAIALLMAETEVTVSGMRVLVLGFGRVGEALAVRLRALGADVCVANRGDERRQRAREQGLSVADWAAWPGELGRFGVVINTVPAMLLGRPELQLMRPDAPVIDLASGAGGVDWAAADELGVRALHASGLPGRVAPLTAGRILGRAYISCLRDEFGLAIEPGENMSDNDDKGGIADGGR